LANSEVETTIPVATRWLREPQPPILENFVETLFS
jgi:hypothetical protein